VRFEFLFYHKDLPKRQQTPIIIQSFISWKSQCVYMHTYNFSNCFSGQQESVYITIRIANNIHIRTLIISVVFLLGKSRENNANGKMCVRVYKCLYVYVSRVCSYVHVYTYVRVCVCTLLMAAED
jgi:hypothetical protein